jgi:hypothetical protein
MKKNEEIIKEEKKNKIMKQKFILKTNKILIILKLKLEII